MASPRRKRLHQQAWQRSSLLPEALPNRFCRPRSGLRLPVGRQGGHLALTPVGDEEHREDLAFRILRESGQPRRARHVRGGRRGRRGPPCVATRSWSRSWSARRRSQKMRLWHEGSSQENLGTRRRSVTTMPAKEGPRLCGRNGCACACSVCRTSGTARRPTPVRPARPERRAPPRAAPPRTLRQQSPWC